jgi:hypothetical protein
MAAIFTSRANLYTQFILLGFGLLCVALAGLVWVAPNTNYASGIGFTPTQPVPFSHQHHVSGLGLDCRYCHTEVETSADAGMPATHTCMTCHSQIWTNAAILAPVRQSLAQNKPLQWNRVYTLPDYVYFDHSIHVAKGVGCTECHGPIGDMPLTYQATSLHMGWCLGCHNDPAPHLRPANAVFDPHWQRTASTPSPAALMAQYHIHVSSLTDCSVCHR